MSNSAVKAKGFFRLNIEEDGKIVGDSGWVENQVTNLGFLNYLVNLIGAAAGSKQIGFVALGSGGTVAAAGTTLPGEISSSTQRTAVTFAAVASTTAQFTATFASSASFLSGASNLSNVGLYAATTTNDTLFSGNTFASSACGTNQNVNVTYQIRFS